jgi:hypothetical protein
MSVEYRLFALAIAVIAVHVVDDNFVQPQPGTSAGDHLVSGVVPLVVLGLGTWAYPRLRGLWRGAMAIAVGVLAIAAAIEAVHYTDKVGASGTTSPACCASPRACSCSFSAR